MHGWRHHDEPRLARVRFRGLPALAVVLTASAVLGSDFGASSAGGGGKVSSTLVGYDTGGSYAATGSTSQLAPAPSSSHGNFSISGGVAGLYPGVVKPYMLSVHNPNAFQITVTSISTVVTSPAAGCAAANLAITAFSGHLVVPGGYTVHAAVTAEMAHSAPNPCQGVVFTLHYTGLGTVS